MLLLAWGHLILAHVHWLLCLLEVVSHLAVLILVTAQLVRVDHGKHLGEALADTSDSLSWVAERQLVPWHEFNTLAVHVNEALFTGSA